MGLFTTMQAAADASQRIIAEISGMAQDAIGNALFAGASKPYVVVFGPTRAVEKMMPVGGYRKRTETLAWLTRSQLTTTPPVRTKITRTDLSPAVVYVIDSVNTQDPLRWEMVLVNFGD